MNIKSLLKKIFVCLILFNFIGYTLHPVLAKRTAAEVQAEIEQKKLELANGEKEVTTMEGSLEENKKALANASGRRATAIAQINLNKSEIELIRKKLEDLNQKKELKELEREERRIRQNNIISESYLDWKQYNLMKTLIAEDNQDAVKVSTYQSAMADSEQKSIEVLQVELTQIDSDITTSQEEQKQFEIKITALQAQMAEIQKQVDELDQKVRQNQGDIQNYRAKLGNIKMQIDELTAEQEEIQRREAGLLGEANNGGTKPLVKGEYYFKGMGREVYQGHGVGMSQFGALGAALEGWDYKKILKHYYPGTTIGTYKGQDTINVTGHGTMTVEEYVAGAGEIPDYSCEDLDIKFDPKNVWKCWPEEAVKAQVVAFRSYGLYKTQGGASICTTAACQVYKGGENKKWAAEATEYEVVLYEGKPISAFYSSDNHNGWGTANNDTIWSNFSGTGTPRPYLRAVEDKNFTFPYTYTYWTWRTNSYSIADIDGMLNWSTKSDDVSASYRDYITGVKAKIGTLKKIDFERDPSGRVKRVKLIGSTGTDYMAGWLFKSVWNIWIDAEKPTGEKDFIYSLTYYMILVD